MNLDKLKEVIQAANPEKFNDKVSRALSVLGPEALRYPIRLSDVLLAMGKNLKPPDYYAISQSGIFIAKESKEVTAQVLNGRLLSTGCHWNLYNDNLDNQSDDTKEFLIDLLTRAVRECDRNSPQSR